MLALDTEFFNTKEEFVTPVCACFYDLQTKITRRFWTLDPASKAKCIEYLNEHKDIPILSWNAVAEGRFLYSLGLDPMDFKWVDLFLEFRCLTNHNDRLNWGKQLVKGKVVMTYKPRPKWQRREGEKLKSFTPTHSLAEATYKLLGIIRDTDHKNNMRDLLISGDLEQIEANRNAISDYCAEDTIHLEDLYQAILSEYRVQGIAVNAQLSIEMMLRGEYSAVTALMESWGYPVNVEAMRNFADSVMPLLEDCQREINRLFPDIKPFKYCRKEKKFKWDQNKTKQWVLANHAYDRWEKTDSFDEAQKHGLITSENRFKFLSLGLEAWQRFYDFKHDYPTDNFGAQMVRYLKLKQSLAGFVKSADKDKKTIWDSLGSDGRIRPYMNIYGSQSSRSQPSSTSFLFLKPAWMRSLCQPGPGKAIGAYDYGSEEYLISALWAEDVNMIEAYKSGDVYLAYAKMIGLVPPDGTKEKYKKERDAQKPVCLAKGSLIFTDTGLKKIENITAKDKVWDGMAWRNCEGTIRTSDSANTYLTRSTYVTQEHKILGEDNEWRPYKVYKREKVHKWKICKEDSGGLRRPRYSWSDVWTLARSIFENAIK